jgi:hypothetical protein
MTKSLKDELPSGTTFEQLGQGLGAVTSLISSGYSQTQITSAIQYVIDNLLPSNLMQYDSIVFFGASIMDMAFSDTTLTDGDGLIKSQYAQEYADGLGFTGVSFYAKAASGATTSGYVSMVDELVADTSITGNVLVVIHGPGNDVSNNRPYTSGQTGGEASMRYVFDTIKARGWDIAYTGVSWRNYAEVAAGDESAGSLPYNENIYYPLIQEYSPDWWDGVDGTPVIDMYNYTKSSNGVILRDTVHPSGNITAGYILGAIHRKMNNLDYDYSGKRIVGCGDFSGSGALENASGISIFPYYGSSYIKDEFGELTPLVFGINGGNKNNVGIGTAGVTDYSLLNSACVSGAYYWTTGVVKLSFWLGDIKYAGLTGKLRLAGSRNSTTGTRFTEYTVQGVTKELNNEANPPTYVEFDFVTGSLGEILVDMNLSEGSTYGYFSSFELIFDA